MRPLPRLSATLLTAGLAAGCVDTSAPRTIFFPHEASRVEGACAGAPVARDIGLVVEAPYANRGARRFRLANKGGVRHEVQARFVVEEAGPCGGDFIRSNKLGLEDAKTCEAPEARSLAPSESIELRIPPHRTRVDGACTKIGVALHVEVDGAPQCVELGTWISHRPDAE